MKPGPPRRPTATVCRGSIAPVPESGAMRPTRFCSILIHISPGAPATADRWHGLSTRRGDWCTIVVGALTCPGPGRGPESEERLALERGGTPSRNAKPVARRGRNATGLIETAGLPKERNPLWRPVLFFLASADRRRTNIGSPSDGIPSRRRRRRRQRCDACCWLPCSA